MRTFVWKPVSLFFLSPFSASGIAAGAGSSSAGGGFSEASCQEIILPDYTVESAAALRRFPSDLLETSVDPDTPPPQSRSSSHRCDSYSPPDQQDNPLLESVIIPDSQPTFPLPAVSSLGVIASSSQSPSPIPPSSISPPLPPPPPLQPLPHSDLLLTSRDLHSPEDSEKTQNKPDLPDFSGNEPAEEAAGLIVRKRDLDSDEMVRVYNPPPVISSRHPPPPTNFGQGFHNQNGGMNKVGDAW